MASRRQERVAEVLKQVVSRIIIEELSDPRLGFTTVTMVKPSPDLRSARVFVSILGDETQQDLTLRALKNAAGFVQHGIADRVDLKFTPVLHFVNDESVKKSVRLSQVIREALEESGGEETPAD